MLDASAWPASGELNRRPYRVVESPRCSGANDGIVSTASLIAGVAAAATRHGPL